MIELNRLSVPGERAALERVEAIVEQIDDLPIERFVPARHTLPSPEDHARLVAELEGEADRCGRRALVDDVRDRVRAAVHARLYGQLRRMPTSVVGYAIVGIRADDAAAIEMTLVDAVAVAVMEDRLATEIAGGLSLPGRALLGLPPLGESAIAPADPVPEPTADDWAAAAAGDAQAGGYTPMPVGLRVAVATVAATILAPVAVFAGVGVGQTGIGILAGFAVVAVCWLAATYHS